MLRLAFTVIELLVVLCIVGIVLALVAGALGSGSPSTPAKVQVDGPLLIVGDTAVLASQIVFVDHGRVWTARSGSNSISTYLPQEEVLAAWKEALHNERQADEPRTR